MADRYVKSGGSGTGADWTTAYATLTAAEAADTAGDNIYVSSSHAESSASAVNLPSAGTLALPTKIVSVSDGAAPPTSVSVGASVTTTGANAISVAGNAYLYGLKFFIGTGASTGAQFNAASVAAAAIQTYEKVSFDHVSPMTANQWRVGLAGATNVGSRVQCIDCTWKFYAAGQGIRLENGELEIVGGSITKDSAVSLTALFVQTNSYKGSLKVNGLDLSGLNAGVNIFSAPGGAFKGIIRNSKLPSGWSGKLSGTDPTPGCRVEMHNCDDGNTNYRMWVQEYAGSIKSETVVTRTGGAMDGTTALAWKMETSADAEFPTLVLASPELAIWNDTTGVAKTVTLHVLTDGVTLKDDEAWLEVTYLGTSGAPLGSVVTDRKAGLLTAAQVQDASSAAWTTTGIASPVMQKLSVTVTPQKKGYMILRAMFVKPGSTMYVCYSPEIS